MLSTKPRLSRDSRGFVLFVAPLSSVSRFIRILLLAARPFALA